MSAAVPPPLAAGSSAAPRVPVCGAPLVVVPAGPPPAPLLVSPPLLVPTPLLPGSRADPGA